MAKSNDNEIEILKTIWQRGKGGAWSGHDLQTISLKPRPGFSTDYFKIQDEMNLMTQSPGQVMDSFFSTFGMTEFLLRQSIVPIIAWNTGDRRGRCIVTGFFISASGLLMTAAHVIRDPVDEGYANVSPLGPGVYKLSDDLHFGVMIPANPAMRNAPPSIFQLPSELRDARWFMCPFEWAKHWGADVESPLLHEPPQFRLQTDIAICKVRESPLLGPYQPLNIGRHRLNMGDRAAAIGYAEMLDIAFDGTNEYQPELVVSVGSVTAVHDDNVKEKSNATPGPNFEFNARIPGRMSGSPILVGSGILTKGVVSRSWQNDNHASGCLVASVMDLPLIHDQTLVDLMKNGKEGIVHLVGGDL
ncbi:MAG: trypsin-like peptidase domain-containing protein [Devosia sp.]|uniref:trypsin-like peptidase domain-containing protein n=1 Tax=Devosia sp. TaxID=1871048 RepID=UPI001A42819A|nr:trypsin-like peptidase domain-containing protein [Devosia sp.]MBL8596657.1 trypsin-like peptidase domain-containing protein [Devosia sp.]